MPLPTQPYKGARDFYPEDMRLRKYMFDVLRRVAESYGYQEYDAPILEPIELYLSKSSEEIITEQTYSFTDRGGRHITIRPEMTPTVSRMVAGRRQELAYPLRWYSIPTVWRYERPQHGRLREFWQPNIDLFGVAGIAADHEIIQVADSIWQAYGAKRDMYEIRLNSRQLINEILNDYVGESADQVNAVIRLVDHKSKMVHEEFLQALAQLVPGDRHQELSELLTKPFAELPDKYQVSQSLRDLLELKELLTESGITNVVDDLSLMRGFDYYTDIVFEVFDTNPENNRAMGGGGRYDGLVGLFGVEPVPTVGFAIGDVTLQDFLSSHDLLPELELETDAVVIFIGDVYKRAQKPLGRFRSEGLNLAVDSSGRKIDAQIKSAVKAGVPYAIFIGDEELNNERFKLKDLRSQEEQEMSFERVVSTIAARHKKTEDL